MKGMIWIHRTLIQENGEDQERKTQKKKIKKKTKEPENKLRRRKEKRRHAILMQLGSSSRMEKEGVRDN